MTLDMLLAIGCGMMSITPAELYAMELREFYAIHAGWRKRQEQQSRERWEIARWQSAITIMPHITTHKPIVDLLPLPWDKQSKVSVNEIDIEQCRASALEMAKYLDYEQ